MSVLGVASGSLLSYLAQNVTQATQGGGQNTAQANNNVPSRAQQFQQEFQQLGQDLQTGNLSGAQSVFSTIQQNAQSFTNAAASQKNPIASAFNQLSQDLQSGNLTAAQQQYTTIQQDFQNNAANPQVAARGGGGHHHVPVEDNNNQNTTTGISQLLNQLGTALQQGNLTNAQQAYNSLQQDLLQFTGNTLTATSSTPGATANANGVSVNA